MLTVKVVLTVWICILLQVASVTYDLLLLLVLGSYLIILFSFLVITTRVRYLTSLILSSSNSFIHIISCLNNCILSFLCIFVASEIYIGWCYCQSKCLSVKPILALVIFYLAIVFPYLYCNVKGQMDSILWRLISNFNLTIFFFKKNVLATRFEPSLLKELNTSLTSRPIIISLNIFFK